MVKSLDMPSNGGFPRAFLYSGGTYTELNPPGSIYSIPTEIKDNGTVIGYFGDSSGKWKGFVYSKGMYTELSAPGYTEWD